MGYTDLGSLKQMCLPDEKELQRIKMYFSCSRLMDDVAEEIVAYLKELHETIKQLGSQVIRLVEHRENGNLRYLADKSFEKDDAFIWYTQCKGGEQIECKFKLCKGTLSTFTGSPFGFIEILPCSGQEAEHYDVIKVRANWRNLASAYYANGVFDHNFYYHVLHQRDAIYEFLVRLTMRHLHVLETLIMLEYFAKLVDRHDPNVHVTTTIKYFLDMLDTIKKKQEVLKKKESELRFSVTAMDYLVTVKQAAISPFTKSFSIIRNLWNLPDEMLDKRCKKSVKID